MTVTVDLENGPALKAPRRLTLLLAGLVLGHGGQLPMQAAVELAWSLRSGNRSGRRLVIEHTAPLVRDEVLVIRDEVLYAPNLADLAAWVADGWEYREDAGRDDAPEIPPAPVEVPVQRGSSRRGRRSAAA